MGRHPVFLCALMLGSFATGAATEESTCSPSDATCSDQTTLLQGRLRTIPEADDPDDPSLAEHGTSQSNIESSEETDVVTVKDNDQGTIEDEGGASEEESNEDDNEGDIKSDIVADKSSESTSDEDDSSELYAWDELTEASEMSDVATKSMEADSPLEVDGKLSELEESTDETVSQSTHRSSCDRWSLVVALGNVAYAGTNCRVDVEFKAAIGSSLSGILQKNGVPASANVWDQRWDYDNPQSQSQWGEIKLKTSCGDAMLVTKAAMYCGTRIHGHQSRSYFYQKVQEWNPGTVSAYPNNVAGWCLSTDDYDWARDWTYHVPQRCCDDTIEFYVDGTTDGNTNQRCPSGGPRNCMGNNEICFARNHCCFNNCNSLNFCGSR